VASALLCAVAAEIDPGDVVAVVGTGVMGYACGQFALAMGAGRVYAVDVVDRKLSLAADRGMVPVDARVADPEAVVGEQTDGVGADVVFAAVGGDQSHMGRGDDPVATAVRSVRRGGRVVQVGHVVGDLTVTPRALRLAAVDWLNPPRGTRQLGPNTDSGELTARLAAGDRLDVDSYVTTELDGLAAFEDAVEIGLSGGESGTLGPAQMVL
jgi:threonine dehydrogenase-like Zn-dependent dehydrogenase